MLVYQFPADVGKNFRQSFACFGSQWTQDLAYKAMWSRGPAPSVTLSKGFQ